ncbi:MAG: phytoene dehydrogenase [Halobacteriovoraceae bacterium]|nr:phytoene dehydrogenase [Halobacteriovoraceae bacterium]|tara:strand:+ start:71400 stop:72875 length:1476 start_codon:yes stop_codon:yes gene_type:complete
MLIKAKEKIEKDYDVVVIGSGLAGMTAANKLAKNGRSVLLLEAHNKLGGFATWFYRANKKHVFDVSLHGFPFGMKKTCRKYWNKEIADHIVQLKSVKFINPQYEIESLFTKEDFTEKLVDHFGVERETVQSFYDYIENMNFYDDQSMTNGELFEKFFPGRNDIARFLMEPIVYANGSTLEDPAITYGIVFSNFMKKGVFTFKGGTDHLIKMMQDELLKNGVDIKKHAPVDQILIENGKTSGVVVKGQTVRAKSVVSNANLRTTIFKLAGKENFNTDYVNKAKEVRMNSSSCQVYFGLKEGETIPFIGDLIFTSTHPKFDTEALLSKEITSRTFSVYYPEGRPYDKDEKYAIVSSTNANWEDWANLSEDEYKAEKEKMIKETIDCLEGFLPGIGQKIDFVDAATPLTVKKYTRHEGGSSFGTKFEGLDVSMNMHKEVSGLFHAGSVGIIMSGWLGAANYGVIQSNEVESWLYQLEKENQQTNLATKENNARV